MATLYLHVGQAGCQLGAEFWAPLVDEISGSETLQLALCHGHLGVGSVDHLRVDNVDNVGQRRQTLHRSIFVDTESKALRDAARMVGTKRIGANVRFGVGGRGSCFPMGFGSRKSQDDLDEHFDFVRQEVEKSDYTSCIVMMHSLGGGTGSGLGTRLFSWLKDAFPLVNLMSVSCAGFAQESPVQNYNSVLAFSRLHSLCDAVILFNNERLVEYSSTGFSTSSSPSRHPEARSSLRDINREICLSLHGAFLPAASLNSHGSRLQSGAQPQSGARSKPGTKLNPGPDFYSGAHLESSPRLPSGAPVSFNLEPLELIRTLAPMPSLNVLQLDSVTQSRDKSPLDHVQNLCRALKRPWKVGSSEAEKLRIAGLSLICRNGAVVDEDCEKKLASSLPFVSWNPFPVDVWRDNENCDNFGIPYLKKSKRRCLTACSNSNRFVSLVRSWTGKTRRLLQAGAFLHWFEKHGCGRDEILDAVNVVDHLALNYDEL